MIDTFHIGKFRGFADLELGQLSRVNLLVGLNCSGKTSVLESLAVLLSGGNLALLEPVMSRRGETLFAPHEAEVRLDVRHLFPGHVLIPECAIELNAMAQGNSAFVRISQGPAGARRQSELFPTNQDPLSWLTIESKSLQGASRTVEVRLERDGGLDPYIVSRRGFDQRSTTPLAFLIGDWRDAEVASQGWAGVALTRQQDFVEEALRTIHPGLDEIAFVPSRTETRGAFHARLKGETLPVPLGSLGDGVIRTMVLVVALVQCENGYLLVDEIDTGLHHSVLPDLWRMLLSAAERLNVQIVASTHSLDCIRALATICDRNADIARSRISMHRIEREKMTAVHYSERQIVIAAERGIETR